MARPTLAARISVSTEELPPHDLIDAIKGAADSAAYILLALRVLKQAEYWYFADIGGMWFPDQMKLLRKPLLKLRRATDSLKVALNRQQLSQALESAAVRRDWPEVTFGELSEISGYPIVLAIGRKCINCLPTGKRSYLEPGNWNSAMERELWLDGLQAVGGWAAIEVDIDELGKRVKREFLAAVDRLEDGIKQSGSCWSVALSPTEWAKRFDRAYNTLQEWEKQGKIRVKKVTPRLWQIHNEDLSKFGIILSAK
jgi:hypothetical protein